MSKKSYICTIESASTSARAYTVTTSSASRAAQELGRGEHGERVTITTRSGRILSRAAWTPEDGGHYFRCR